MYIEFDILGVDCDFDSLEQAVHTWARQQDVPFTTKVAKGLKYRLGLNSAEHFTLFFLTWHHCAYKVKNADRS